jgi:Rod binding domain-containing protein
MTETSGVTGTSTRLLAAHPAAKGDDPIKVANAAKEFEALLLGQMLRSVREADSAGWLGSGGDDSNDCAMAIAEEQFAKVLSSNGGLGLAHMVVTGLAKTP